MPGSPLPRSADVEVPQRLDFGFRADSGCGEFGKGFGNGSQSELSPELLRGCFTLVSGCQGS